MQALQDIGDRGLLWEVPPTARKPDAVLHRCIPDAEQLMAQHVPIAVEVLSTWSARRDRVHKMSDYADAGIPHYWLVAFDKAGAVTIERYTLAGAGGYVHIARAVHGWPRRGSAVPSVAWG
jgi:Uma2 family endonuclease